MATNKYSIEITPCQGYVSLSGDCELMLALCESIPAGHIIRMGGKYYLRALPSSGQSSEELASKLSIRLGVALPSIMKGVVYA